MFIRIFACCFAVILVGCGSVAAISEHQTLDSYFGEIGFSGSVLVAMDGEVIHAEGYGYANRENQTPNSKDTPFYIGSLTKQFTALAILQLQEQGKLTLNDPISRYFPDFPNGDAITLLHLLNHLSGLYNFTDQWEQVVEEKMNTQQIIELIKRQPLEFEPGSDLSYSNSGYVQAGMVIEIISGMPYSDYIDTHIFAPLNMTHSGHWHKHRESVATGYLDNQPQDQQIPLLTTAAGELISSSSDLLLWDQPFYQGALINKQSTAQHICTLAIEKLPALDLALISLKWSWDLAGAFIFRTTALNMRIRAMWTDTLA